MVGRRRNYKYQDDKGNAWRISLDNSNAIAVGNDVVGQFDAKPLPLPRGYVPRTATYQTTDGIFVRRIVLSRPPRGDYPPEVVTLSTVDGPKSFSLVKIRAEEVPGARYLGE